jgi:hypothetical protein
MIHFYQDIKGWIEVCGGFTHRVYRTLNFSN